jgi:hypothetical protein
MSDEIRAAAERLRGIEGPTFHGIGGKRHVSEREYADAVTLARAWLAEHTPTPDGPPAAAPEWTAGGRWMVPAPYSAGHWFVLERNHDNPKLPREIAGPLSEADAALLAHGPARLRAMEAENTKLRAALELVLGDWTNVKARDAARAALGYGSDERQSRQAEHIADMLDGGKSVDPFLGWLQRLLAASEPVREVVREMCAVAESATASEAERRGAISTIAYALYPERKPTT